MILARFACSEWLYRRVADYEIFSPQTQVASIRGVAVRARLFYNFPLDLVINIFIFKLPDIVTQFSTVLLFYIGK